MSSTLRDATEHTVHQLTDLVSDSLHHLDLPHLDLAHVGRRRRSLSTGSMVAIGVVVVLAIALVVRTMRARAATSRGSKDTAADAPTKTTPSSAAA
jgi:hypothetical protein